jgi:hypothetical protein
VGEKTAEAAASEYRGDKEISAKNSFSRLEGVSVLDPAERFIEIVLAGLGLRKTSQVI